MSNRIPARLPILVVPPAWRQADQEHRAMRWALDRAAEYAAAGDKVFCACALRAAAESARDLAELLDAAAERIAQE